MKDTAARKLVRLNELLIDLSAFERICDGFFGANRPAFAVCFYFHVASSNLNHFATDLTEL